MSQSAQRGPDTAEVRVRSSQNGSRWVIAVAFSAFVSTMTVGRPKARANVSWIDWSVSTLMRSVSRHGGRPGGSARRSPAWTAIRHHYNATPSVAHVDPARSVSIR